MKIIDLRSDTVTQPTPAMRQAMAQAELGDDVFGEDPTVNRLEAMAAQLLGIEAALFTASGTMSNLLAVLSHCRRGDEMILGDQAHMFLYEVGGSAALAGVHPHPIPNDSQGRLSTQEVEAAIRPPNIHFPPTGLICLENTHNRCGGAVLTSRYTREIGELARGHGIALHLDGARLLNAAVYLGVEPAELTRHVSSVSLCLSKGLAAPVGSVLCGRADFIARARKYRKMVGGGMRQAGVIAAAGIVALETMVERLAEDHAHARMLAEGLAAIKGLTLDPATVQTNIVIFEVRAGQATELQSRLAAAGVKVSSLGGSKLRAVTHYGIERCDIESALASIAQVLRDWSKYSRAIIN